MNLLKLPKACGEDSQADNIMSMKLMEYDIQAALSHYCVLLKTEYGGEECSQNEDCI